MKAVRFISERIRFKGYLALICVAVSYLVMIVAVSVSSGFRNEIRQSLSNVMGDVRLVPLNEDLTSGSASVPAGPAFLPKVKELDCVGSVRPVVSRAGIIRQDEIVHGALFKGVPDMSFPDSVAFPLSVPSRLASILNIGQGDKIAAYFVGDKVVVRKFTVCDVYDEVLSSDNQLICLTSLPVMQRVNSWDSTKVSSFELFLKKEWQDEERIAEAGMQVASTMAAFSSEDEPTLFAQTLQQTFPVIFSWFYFLDLNVLVLLVLMTIVAGFNVISGLLILLFENISTIGLLKSMGMKDRGIAAVFLRSAGILSLKGLLLGNVLAVFFCIIEGRTHWLKLDPANYFLSYVPVDLDWGWILTADAVSFAVIMLLLLLPSIFISKVDPAATMRVE